MRSLAYIVIALLLLAPVGAGLVGRAIGPGLLDPMRLNPERLEQTAEMLNDPVPPKKKWSEPLKWHTKLGTVSGKGNTSGEKEILPEISANGCCKDGDLRRCR